MGLFGVGDVVMAGWLVEKLRAYMDERKQKKREEELIDMQRPPLDDWETRDKSLRALRRLRRRQIDEVEKDQLNKAINAFNHQRDVRGLIGDSPLSSDDASRRLRKAGKQRFIQGDSFLGRGGLL